MKKLFSAVLAACLLFCLFGCSPNETEQNSDIYSMNASIAMGAPDDGNLNETKVSYDITISGDKTDLENIESQDIMINPADNSLLVDLGSSDMEYVDEEIPYVKIKGSVVFYTEGRSKEEISEMAFLTGIELTDNDSNTYQLTF